MCCYFLIPASIFFSTIFHPTNAFENALCTKKHYCNGNSVYKKTDKKNVWAHTPRFDKHVTETTVHVTFNPITQRAMETSHLSNIGRPLPNFTLYLLSPTLQPVPLGVTGELYVGGPQVARGYLNRPALSSERFVASPFGPGRLYRTGDTGKHLPDGSIVYFGRID